MAQEGRTETCGWEIRLKIHFNNCLIESCVRLHTLHFLYIYITIETVRVCLTWKFHIAFAGARSSAILRRKQWSKRPRQCSGSYFDVWHPAVPSILRISIYTVKTTLLLLLLLLLLLSSSLVTGLFFLVLLLNQRWSPPLGLQASHCSTFRVCVMFQV